MTDNMPLDAHTARSTLRLARDAMGAARRAQPALPTWYAPVRGLLFAAASGLLFGPWALHAPFLIAGILAVLAFLGIHAVAVYRGGIITMPGGTLRQRVLRQLVPVPAFGFGWLMAVPFGQAGGALAAAVLGGAALWAVTVWEGKARS